MLTSFANAILRILLFRAGPQDLPFAPELSRLLIPLALVGNYITASISVPPGLAAVSSAMSVLGLAIAVRTLLRMRKLENRYTQTFHALLVIGFVIGLASYEPLTQLMPEMLRLAQHPEIARQHPETVNLPAGAFTLIGVLLIWNFALTAHVLRHAADMKIFAGVAAALLMSVVLQLFVGFASQTIGMLFGLLPPAVVAP